MKTVKIILASACMLLLLTNSTANKMSSEKQKGVTEENVLSDPEQDMNAAIIWIDSNANSWPTAQREAWYEVFNNQFTDGEPSNDEEAMEILNDCYNAMGGESNPFNPDLKNRIITMGAYFTPGITYPHS